MRPRRVILLIESSRQPGRDSLLGIAAYIRNHGAWQILHLENSLTDEVPKVEKPWKGDGIISRINNERMARSVARLRLPVVDLRGRIYGKTKTGRDKILSRPVKMRFKAHRSA